MTDIEQFAMRLLARQLESVSELDQRFWAGLVKQREFALLAEELVVRSLHESTLSDTDRRTALALPGLTAIHRLLELQKKSA